MAFGEDSILVRLGANIDGLLAGMSEAATAVQGSTLRMSESLGGLGTAIERVKVPFVALMGLMAGGALFKEVIAGATNLAVQLDVLSQKTGVAVTRLSELEQAAQLSHVGNEDLEVGLRKLAVSMQEAEMGTGKAALAFKAMGLDVRDFHGDTDALFTAVAHKFAGYKDDAQKAALATDIFGRSGTSMIPLMNNLDAATAKVKALGMQMTKEQEESLLKYHAAMEELKIALEGVGRAIAEKVAGPLAAMANLMTIATARTHEFITAMLQLASGDPFKAAATLASTGAGIGLFAGEGGAGKKGGKGSAPSIADQEEKPGAGVGGLISGTSLEMQRFMQKYIETGRKTVAEFNKMWDEQLTKQAEKEDKGAHEYVHTIQEQSRQVQEETRKVQEAMAKQTKQIQQEWMSVFSAIGNAFQESMRGVIQGTITMHAAMHNMIRSIELEFIASEEKKLATKAAAYLASKSITVEDAIVTISSDAWKAAAATYAAIAQIPYVGPFLAPLAAAGAAAEVLSFVGRIAHAAGGYDVPAGLNPITQLHAQEMVLPAHLANPLRSMLAGGGGGSPVVHLNVQAWDARGVGDFLMSNRGALSAAMGRALKENRV